ncbi:uncharacterized protein E0L32_008436 [Thyridium curvatum]|uniref:AB hydrolase-1 domain-containing protein n=1 Tax=Thyridium curvatum TaxID=1093900 RepID=A0A507B1X1_9PEZI|nr:uncharacterized protein E0L32_008436 [Thyridium curvatum]TPX10550.1 hypothetical protein E0L32_008436 [Thyridium curvatum]
MADTDLSKLNRKTLRVSRGFTYTYYTSPARDSSKPTLILFHGWPDTARLFAGLANDYLVPNGYGIVAPDCLGYGGTSKPTDDESYAWQRMAADAVEILDAEGLDRVVSAGHDWGSALAQRLYHFHPARVAGLVTLNVPYLPPTGDFDLEAANAATRQAWGAGVYEYWRFFTAGDAPALMARNLESVYSAAHGEPATWEQNWCSPGGMRAWVSEGRTQPTLPYASGEHKADFMRRFDPSEGGGDGFEAPSCWYSSFAFGVQNAADRLLPKDAWTVRVPTLFWGGAQDFVCRPAGMQPSIDAGYLPNATVIVRDGGHWALLAIPDVFGEDLLSWLQSTF